MATKQDLREWVKGAVDDGGGSVSVVEAARYIWEVHEAELRNSGDLFYTWQYDMRWAAQQLRNEGWLGPTTRGQGSRWVKSQR